MNDIRMALCCAQRHYAAVAALTGNEMACGSARFSAR